MDDKAYGDFEEVSDEAGGKVAEGGEAPARARMPRQGEVIGKVIQRFGGARMEVLSTDGKRRNCRVPGRFKRILWLRPGDFVLIKPWPDDNEKADVIFKYNSSALSQLRKKGLLEALKEEF